MGKVIIRCKLDVLTGLHIGAPDSYSAIGATDLPVVRNSRTGAPIIPGSSLKGKVRSLLAKYTGNPGPKLPQYDKEPEEIKRLFGTANDKERAPVFSRLKFSDADVTRRMLEDRTRSLTEVKAENAINRANAEATPRLIERVAPDTEFNIVITYDEVNEDDTEEDLKTLSRGLKLLEMDALGGHGSRGSGRVSFRDFNIEVFNPINPSLTEDTLKPIFDSVENYELFNF